MTLKSLGIGALLLLASCGYNLREDNRAFFEKHKIHRLYVAPAKNGSFKAGAEITIYNALRKKISQGGYVQLVDRPEIADAVMREYVQEAVYSPMAPISPGQMSSWPSVDQSGPVPKVIQANPLPGSSGVVNSVQVASLSQAKLRVRFVLAKQENGAVLWQEEITRYKNFANSIYLGALGNTSALINATEFDRALSDLSTIVVTDAEESVNSIL